MNRLIQLDCLSKITKKTPPLLKKNTSLFAKCHKFVIIKFPFEKNCDKYFINIKNIKNCQLKRYTPVAKLSCLISDSLSERKIHPQIYWSCQICCEVCFQIVWIASDGILHTCNISSHNLQILKYIFITVQIILAKKGEI